MKNYISLHTHQSTSIIGIAVLLQLALSPSIKAVPVSIASTEISLTSSPTIDVRSTYDCTSNKQDSTQRFYVDGISHGKKTCEWAGRNAEVRCTKLNVMKYCPITCGLCPPPPQSNVPTTPRAIKSPSKTPSISPIPYDCTDVHDSEKRFDVPSLGRKRSCEWAGTVATKARCSNDIVVAVNCPVTCGLCAGPALLEPTISKTEVPQNKPITVPAVLKIPSKLPSINPTEIPTSSYCTDKEDSTHKFTVRKQDTLLKKDCEWVRRNSKKIKRKCGYEGVKDMCPIACGLCPEFPSITPIVTSTLKLEVGPVDGGKQMNDEEKSHFEDKVRVWLQFLLNKDVPKIILKNVDIIAQTTTTSTSRRRILTNSQGILKADVKFDGEYNATTSFKTPSDVNFGDKLKTHFLDTDEIDTLIGSLKSTSNNGTRVEYFNSVVTISPDVSTNPAQSRDPQDNPQKNRNRNTVWITAVAFLGAFLFFAVANFVSTQAKKMEHMRRTHHVHSVWAANL